MILLCECGSIDQERASSHTKCGDVKLIYCSADGFFLHIGVMVRAPTYVHLEVQNFHRVRYATHWGSILGWLCVGFLTSTAWKSDANYAKPVGCACWGGVPTAWGTIVMSQYGCSLFTTVTECLRVTSYVNTDHDGLHVECHRYYIARWSIWSLATATAG